MPPKEKLDLKTLNAKIENLQKDVNSIVDRVFSHEVNIEAILDLVEVMGRVRKLNVVKNSSGMVEDVSLDDPICDDSIAVFAMENVIDFHEMRKSNTSLSDEEMVSLRRNRLEKEWKGE